MIRLCWGIFLCTCLSLLTVSQTQAQNCTGGIPYAKAMWKAYKAKAQVAGPERRQTALKMWRSQTSGQGKAPQALEPKKLQQGQLWSQSSRYFVSLPVQKDELSLYFILNKGEGKVKLNICTMDAKGQQKHIQTMVLNEETGKEGKKIRLRDVRGQVLVVQLRNFGAIGAVGYKLGIQ